jgi:hypothetical protein
MSNQRLPTPKRQLIGRRLGIEPYYAVTMRSPKRVELHSHPQEVRRPGLRIALGGAALLAVGLLLLISAALNAGRGDSFANVALVVALGGLLGGIGGRRLLGGIAVATTRNSIVADATERIIVYTQSNRVARVRSQYLHFDQVRNLRRVERTLLTSGPLQRRVPLIILEFVLVEGEAWLVDSAADGAKLNEAAEALAEVLSVNR